MLEDRVLADWVADAQTQLTALVTDLEDEQLEDP